MSRLASVCAVLLLAAAPFKAAAAPAPPAPPSPDAIKAMATSQVSRGCTAVPASCAELTAIEAGYRAELAKLEPCQLKGRCTPEQVLASFRAAELLDARENALPPEARATAAERPLLRLSLLLSKDATFAYAAVSPDGLIDTWKMVGPYASKDVDAVCALLAHSQTCLDALKSQFDARLVVDLAKTCDADPKKCDYDMLENAAETSEESWITYQRACAGSDVVLGTLFALIKEGQDRLALLVEADMKKKEQALTAGISDLSLRVDTLDGDRGGSAMAASQFNALSNTYRQASIEADRLTSYGASDSTHFRDGVNAAAARLAAVRSRLAVLSAGEVAKSLAPSAGPGDLPSAAAAGAQGSALVKGPSAADAALLDRRLIPPPPPKRASAPPILEDGGGLFRIIRDLNSDDPLRLADARRRTGQTYTVGDPSTRAALVHTQQYVDDCAVVTQQEVLLAHGLVSNADPVATEKALTAQALLRGFINMNGTPTAYAADLLVDHHLLVDKRAGAPLTDLDAAVRRGGLVIAAVDARYLWDRTDPSPMGHSILITGAEIDKTTKQTVGYYINDSGRNPPGAGRFVPVATFSKAWDGLTKQYAEVR